MHVAGELHVRYEDDMVIVNDLCYQLGRASGAGCNCLIDTLRQLLDLRCDARAVRNSLRALFPEGPDRVTAQNFLDLRMHWQAIVRLLGEFALPRPVALDPNTMRFVCADMVYLSQGDIVGNSTSIFHLARTGTNHFVPLIRLGE